MKLTKYEVFLKAAETGSLTAAALQLNYTQSGISQIIETLEAEFGFPLLIRRKTGVLPTSEGARLLQLVREVLNRNEQLLQEVAAIRGLQTGLVRVGTFSSVAVHWLPTIIQAFQQDFPLIELRLSDGVYQSIEDWIAKEEIDCGFITQKIRKELDYIPLIEDRMLAILPPGHPLCSLERLPFTALATEPFIIPGEGSHYDIGQIFQKAGIRPHVRFAVNDDYAAISMVEHDIGISILPELVLKGQPHQVHYMELEVPTCRTIGIAARSLQQISPACREFINCVKRVIPKLIENGA